MFSFQSLKPDHKYNSKYSSNNILNLLWTFEKDRNYEYTPNFHIDGCYLLFIYYYITKFNIVIATL